MAAIRHWDSLKELPRCAKHECMTTDIELDQEILDTIGCSYNTSIKRAGHWLYEYVAYLGFIHAHPERETEHNFCDAKYISWRDEQHNVTIFRINCCGKEYTMPSRRQLLNRQAFMERNQKRVPTLITIEGSEFTELETPYHREFVEALKAEIPARDRYWDKTRRRWGVKNERKAQAFDILSRFFFDKIQTGTEPPSLTAQITRDSSKLVNDAVAAAKARLIKERGPGSIVI